MMSQRARYAFKALFAIAVATGEDAVQSRDIAEAESIPHAFLEQILTELKRGGLLVSRRGKDGGYRLARPAAAITLAEVLRLIDGPVAPLRCLSRTAYAPCQDCRDEERCRLRRIFAQVFDAFLESLEGRTLAEALARPATTADVLTQSA